MLIDANTLPSDNTLNQLFIRTYQPKMVGHQHTYAQILIPLKGYIDITLDEHDDKQTVTVRYGEGSLIKRGCYHAFSADNDCRFLVVNLDDKQLESKQEDKPTVLTVLHQHATSFALDDGLLLYLAVIEKQLMSAVSVNTQRLLFELLIDLLNALDITKPIDTRLLAVIAYLKKDLSAPHSLASMANVACMSESHFKTLFKEQMDCTATTYLTELRMKKAHGLLLNTDIPVALLAQQCGYQSVSSFIRRFSTIYGSTPAKLRSHPNLVSAPNIVTA